MEAYGWSYDQALSRTMPQIIMLGHASHITSERKTKRMEVHKTTSSRKKEIEEDDPVVLGGKRLSELSTNEYMLYFSGS